MGGLDCGGKLTPAQGRRPQHPDVGAAPGVSMGVPLAAHASQTLNPCWAETVTLTAPQCPLSWLAHQELWLSVWDKGLVREEKLLGQGCVRLAEACDSLKPVPFRCQLSLHGEAKSHVFGWVTVRQPTVQASSLSLKSAARKIRQVRLLWPSGWGSDVAQVVEAEASPLTRWLGGQ